MKEISREQAEALFREYSDRIYRTALFLSKSPALAEDIAQDTFLQAFRNFNRYDPGKPIGPWLYKIAVNTARNALRRQKWMQPFKEPPDYAVNSVEDKIQQNEREELLWKAVNDLTRKSREIIVLHYYSGFKLSEVAGILGIPLGTCKSRLNTALRALEKQLPKTGLVIDGKGEGIYEII